MITERDIMHHVQSGKLEFTPLSLDWLGSAKEQEHLKTSTRPDITLRVQWRKRTFVFGAEVKARYTQQVVDQAVAVARHITHNSSMFPMVIVPYLNESLLQRLEEQAVSGIDLCGNGVIVIPDEVLLFRTGYPNKYPSSEPIKNIYSGTSSLVARVFLLRVQYPSVSDIQREIAQRGSVVALSTVSKVLSSLEAEVIVSRKNGVIRLLQPEKLIDNLTRDYRTLPVTRRFQAKYLADAGSVMEAFITNAKVHDTRCAMTGAGSVNLYAAMTPFDKLSLYCTDIDALLFSPSENNAVPLEETSRFPDIELFETNEEQGYFDIRRQNLPRITSSYYAASPIQTYLELTAGGPREKQTAEQVRQYILNSIRQQQS